MMKLYPLTLVATVIATSSHATTDQYRTQWGVLADLAGQDYFMVHNGQQMGIDRIEWVVPGNKLRIAILRDKKDIMDCVLGLQAGALRGMCRNNFKRDVSFHADLRDNGAVKLKLEGSDFLFGKQNYDWGTFMRGKEPGTFQWEVTFLERYALVPRSPTSEFGRWVKWGPEMLARVGHVTKPQIQQDSASVTAAPSPTPPKPPPPPPAEEAPALPPM